eukprot:1129176-Prorocentrum_lima.AAC.1
MRKLEPIRQGDCNGDSCPVYVHSWHVRVVVGGCCARACCADAEARGGVLLNTGGGRDPGSATH